MKLSLKYVIILLISILVFLSSVYIFTKYKNTHIEIDRIIEQTDYPERKVKLREIEETEAENESDIESANDSSSLEKLMNEIGKKTGEHTFQQPTTKVVGLRS